MRRIGNLFWGGDAHEGTRAAVMREILRTVSAKWARPIVCFAVACLLCRCADLEPGAEEGTISGLVVAPYPSGNDMPLPTTTTNHNTASSGNVATSNSNRTTGSNTNNNNTTTPTTTPTSPSSTALTKNAQGFTGASPTGFMLRSTDVPTLCLTASSTSFALGSAYTYATCENKTTQLFYWSQGTLAQIPGRCLTGSFTAGTALSIAACPTPPGWGQGSLGTTPAVWLLSSDTNTLYTNSPNGGATYTVVPSSSVAAGNGLKAAPLSGTSTIARLAASTTLSGTGPVRIYLNDGSKRCLTEVSGTAVMAPCATGQTNQGWQLRDHTIVSATSACLSINSVAYVSTTACNSGDPNQQWFLAGGMLAVATPYPYVSNGSLALSISAGSDAPYLTTMPSANAQWSIGALDYY